MLRSSRLAAGYLAMLALGLPPAIGDEPDGPRAPASRPVRPEVSAGRPATPPACPNHRRPGPGGPRARRHGPSPPGVPGFGPMSQIFQDMQDSLARDPAGGFQDFLATQERRALREISISPAEERRLGRVWRERYLREAAARGFQVDADPEKLRYLRDLVEAFSPHLRHRDRYREIEVTLLDSAISDGQSFPGGFLVFTTALLDEPDEASVAGVVAHELAHLDLGHLHEYARRAKLADAAIVPGGPVADPTRFMTQGLALGSLAMNPFRPEHELEADCAAATWLYLEGYDPRALVGFFDRIHEQRRDRPDHPFFKFTRSHPDSLERGREVRDRLGQLRRWRRRDDLGLYPDNLRRLVSRPREQGRAGP